jgi:peptide-methionine (R)-S-oxide reductase
MTEPKERSEQDWAEALTPEQFEVLRRKGTEPAFTGHLLHKHDTGAYTCAGCGAALFQSDAKFESGSGWPSFFQPADHETVATHDDLSHGMRRTEVTCARCGGHLGHVFPDGPAPTGLRYCINSLALDFEPVGADIDATSPSEQAGAS